MTLRARDSSPAPRMLGSVLVSVLPGSSRTWGLVLFSRLTDKAVKDYSAYRSSLLFWALVDLIYNMFKVRRPLGVLARFGRDVDVCACGSDPASAADSSASLPRETGRPTVGRGLPSSSDPCVCDCICSRDRSCDPVSGCCRPSSTGSFPPAPPRVTLCLLSSPLFGSTPLPCVSVTYSSPVYNRDAPLSLERIRGFGVVPFII